MPSSSATTSRPSRSDLALCDDDGVSTSVVPVDRRPAIDVVRIGALAMVVVGHLLMAVVDRGDDDALRGVNLFELAPGWRSLTLLSPMPLFFAAAGWANTAASVESAARRLRPLVGLAAVVVSLWYLPALIELVVRGERGVFGDGARLATQPVWFLAAYLPFAAAGSWMARMARRPGRSIGACLGLLAVVDVARFALGADEIVGWLGFLPAWAVPWLLGAWWRQAVAGTRDVRRIEVLRGAPIAMLGASVGAVLVTRAGYSPTLIDVVSSDRSNTTPPTLFTAAAAATQVGLLMLAAGALDRLGAQHRRLVERAGEVSVPVYLWHLTALALCSGIVALGVPVPKRLTLGWWLTRPIWWAAVLATTAGLVALTAQSRTVLTRRAPQVRPTSTVGLRLVWLGVALGATGAALVGVRGPATVVLATTAGALLVGGWKLLRV